MRSRTLALVFINNNNNINIFVHKLVMIMLLKCVMQGKPERRFILEEEIPN